MMKIIFTRATNHLQPYFLSPSNHFLKMIDEVPEIRAYNTGEFTSGVFSDGERFIRVSPQLAGQTVWVVANTIAPAENLLELFLLLDALQRLDCTIYLLFTYFAYARQDDVLPGQALSAEVISTFLKQFIIKEIHIIHIHSNAMHSYLSFANYIPYSFFSGCVNQLPIDVIVAPDKGAHELVTFLSEQTNKEVAFLEKIRADEGNTTMIALEGDVSGKNILIVDDMISTAGTIVSAAQLLQEQGAKEIYVTATHGIFSDEALSRINASAIKKVFVTNSLDVTSKSAKVSVVDISSVISEIIFKNSPQ